MGKISPMFPLLLVLTAITDVHCLENDPYDFSSSYFCSTCFTNNQDQNYHCCFYFFKCCAEARRGSKSTTPGLNYPALPTHIAYIVQDRTIHPCPKDCHGNVALCCLSWNSQNAQTAAAASTTESYFQAAQEFEGYVEADSMVKNSSEDDDDSSDDLASSWPTSEKYPDTDQPFHLALGANVNPSKLDSSYFGSTKKLFIPPSLASGHESFDASSNKDEVNSRKIGWITKDLLKFSEDEKK